jgi:hypothetical protein
LSISIQGVAGGGQGRTVFPALYVNLSIRLIELIMGDNTNGNWIWRPENCGVAWNVIANCFSLLKLFSGDHSFVEFSYVILFGSLVKFLG